MTEQAMWALAIVAVLLAGAIGFFVGRQSGGTKKRIAELESEMSRQNDEIAGYKREVEAHFDKTATLFVSMAGSYKNLFEHLSSGYEKLSAGSARDLFKERFSAVLLEGVSGDRTLDEGAGTEAPMDQAGTPGEAARDQPATTPEQKVAAARAKADGEAPPEAAEGKADSNPPAEAPADESPKAGSAEPAEPTPDDQPATPPRAPQTSVEEHTDAVPAPTEDAVRDLSQHPAETKPGTGDEAR